MGMVGRERRGSMEYMRGKEYDEWMGEMKCDE